MPLGVLIALLFAKWLGTFVLLLCLIKPHRGSAKDKDQNNFLFMNPFLCEVLGEDACHGFCLSHSCLSYEKNASHTYQVATIQLLMQMRHTQGPVTHPTTKQLL